MLVGEAAGFGIIFSYGLRQSSLLVAIALLHCWNGQLRCVPAIYTGSSRRWAIIGGFRQAMPMASGMPSRPAAGHLLNSRYAGDATSFDAAALLSGALMGCAIDVMAEI